MLACATAQLNVEADYYAHGKYLVGLNVGTG